MENKKFSLLPEDNRQGGMRATLWDQKGGNEQVGEARKLTFNKGKWVSRGKKKKYVYIYTCIHIHV